MFGGSNNKNNKNQQLTADELQMLAELASQTSGYGQKQSSFGLPNIPEVNSPIDHGRNAFRNDMEQFRTVTAHSAVELNNKNLFSGYDRITSQNISDSDNIALLERYVLGENRQEFFDSLVQNSDTYFYIKFLDQLNRCGVQIPQEIKAEFDDYILSQNTNSKKILLKWIIMQIDDPQTKEAKKEEWLSALNDEFFKFKYDFQRPSQIKNLDNFQTNDPETNFQVFPSTLPSCYNDVFSSDLYFECLYDNTEAIEKLQAFAAHNSEVKEACLNNKKWFNYLWTQIMKMSTST